MMIDSLSIMIERSSDHRKAPTANEGRRRRCVQAVSRSYRSTSNEEDLEPDQDLQSLDCFQLPVCMFGKTC